LSDDADARADCLVEKDLQTQAFSRAAEGIRTLDLLHGKQNASFPLPADIPCKRPCSRVLSVGRDSTAFTGKPPEFRHPTGTQAPGRLAAPGRCCGGTAPSPPPGVRRDRQGDHRGPQQRLPCRVDSRAVGGAAGALGCGRLGRGRVHDVSFRNLAGLAWCDVKPALLLAASRPGKTLVRAPWLPTCSTVRSLGAGHVHSCSWAAAARPA
jgi:hypothetical protein